ncbi:glycosyltransferase [Deferribacter autotrophicus]|nr:glycosyltransferase [Deferribacter autotrophicus]
MNKSIPVLCYHKVSYSGGITPEQFEEHLFFLKKNGYQTITTSQLYQYLKENTISVKKPFLITFDDCFLDNWIYAIPLLEKYSFNAVFFAISNFIWDGEPRNKEWASNILTARECFINALKNKDYSQFMNSSELYKAVYHYGHEVLSHTQSHQMCFKNLYQTGNLNEKSHWGVYGIYEHPISDYPLFQRGSAYAYNGFWPVLKDNGFLDFRYRSDEERFKFCFEEFINSRNKIEEIINKRVDFICWPWGEFDNITIDAAKEAGYKGAFTLERFCNSYGTNPFYINRIGIVDKTSVRWLSQKMKIYSSKYLSMIFFKKYRKKNDFGGKVLFVTDSTKRSSGGIKQLIYNAKSLKEKNVQVYLAAKKDAYVSSLEDIFDKIVFLDFNKKLLSAKKLAFFIKENKIKVVHTFHNKGHKVGVLSKVFYSKFRLFVNRGVLKVPNNIFYYNNVLIDGFICNSHACKESLKKIFVNPKKINVVFNCIDFEELERDLTSKKIFMVLYIGNTNPIKGFDIFNQIVKKIPKRYNIQFVALGVAKEKLKFQIDKRIELPGTVKNVASYLKDANLFVLTSRSESFPNSLLEAMSFGLPVVAHSVGAVNDLIIDGKNGFVVDNLDIDKFANKILFLYNNRKLSQRMGDNNREIIRQLSCMNKGLKLIKVYSGQFFEDKINAR